MVDDIEHETISNSITNTSCDYAGAVNKKMNQLNKRMNYSKIKAKTIVMWHGNLDVSCDWDISFGPTRKEHRLQCSSVGSCRRIEQFDFVIHAMDDDCVRLRHCLRHHRLLIGIHQHIGERLHRG